MYARGVRASRTTADLIADHLIRYLSLLHGKSWQDSGISDSVVRGRRLRGLSAVIRGRESYQIVGAGLAAGVNPMGRRRYDLQSTQNIVKQVYERMKRQWYSRVSMALQELEILLLIISPLGGI